eukprot:150787-Amphidinium_carterae.1
MDGRSPSRAPSPSQRACGVLVDVELQALVKLLTVSSSACNQGAHTHEIVGGQHANAGILTPSSG